ENVVTQNARPTETKLSRQARTRKNKKLRRDQKQAKMLHELDVDISLLIDDIVFDPSQHRIQSATRKISANNNIYYLEREWTSIPSALQIGETDVSIERSSPNTTNKQLWVAFSQWLGLKGQDGLLKESTYDSTSGCYGKNSATAFNTRREKARLIISAHHNLQSISELVQFKHIAEPECITDL
ncbi:21123_t:CDS:2, partial [Racocetra persica]